MEPASIELIKTIATDAIKILGPATIAAVATYRAAKSQFEIKLKELDKTHEFNAREHLFNYYKERQQKLSKDYEELSGSLGHNLGYAAGYTNNGNEEESNGGISKIFSETVELFTRITPMEIDIAVRDMERNELQQTEEYKKLNSYKTKITALDTERTFEALKKNTLMILEVYHFLLLSNQILLQHQIDKIFSKYIEA